MVDKTQAAQEHRMLLRALFGDEMANELLTLAKTTANTWGYSQTDHRDILAILTTVIAQRVARRLKERS